MSRSKLDLDFNEKFKKKKAKVIDELLLIIFSKV